MYINNFRGDSTERSATVIWDVNPCEQIILWCKDTSIIANCRHTFIQHTFSHCCAPVLLFSKLNKIFFGYFDPENMIFRWHKWIFFGVTSPIFRRKKRTAVRPVDHWQTFWADIFTSQENHNVHQAKYVDLPNIDVGTRVFLQVACRQNGLVQVHSTKPTPTWTLPYTTRTHWLCMPCDVSFYNSTASSWTLATPRTTWEWLHTMIIHAIWTD